MDAQINWSQAQYDAYGTRPQVASHGFAESPLFTDAGLEALLDDFPRHELQAFTMGSNPEDPSDWGCVHTGDLSGAELLAAVRKGALWLNLLWVERFNREYAELLDTMYQQLSARIPRLQGYREPHLTLLISSPNAQVYYHFDAEDNMLWHVRGEKTIWLFDEALRREAPPQIVEDIFAGTRSEELPFKRSFESRAMRCDLQPGDVASWPHNTPHRIENADSLNVSLSTSVITPLSERRWLTHCANRWLRSEFGDRNWRIDETGLRPMLKRNAYRVMRRVGRIKPEPHPEYVARWRMSPDAERGMVALDPPERTAFCSVAKAQMSPAERDRFLLQTT